MAKMQTVQVPQRLPVVLSREEVSRLIAAAPNLKSQAALSVACATGLRVSEVVSLKVTPRSSVAQRSWAPSPTTPASGA